MAVCVASPKNKERQSPAETRRKKFAPWETIFDDMFMLWFGLDVRRHDEKMDAAGEAG